MPWGSNIDTEEKARAFIVRLADRATCDQGRGYAIWLDGEMVGGALYRTFDVFMGNCEIGVWLAKHATGHGLVTRTCNILIDWAFHKRNMTRIEWHCAVGNMPSRNIAQRLGMKLDGVMRKSFAYREFRHDMEVWSLLPSDVRSDINDVSSQKENGMSNNTEQAPEIAAARKSLEQYIQGHKTRDASVMRCAFLATAHVEGMREGGFLSWEVETYCALFDGVPAADEGDRVRTINSIEVYESVAMARMTLRHGTVKFTDMFVLLKDSNGEWKIANKVYHAEPI